MTMTTSFDIHLLPVSRYLGQEQTGKSVLYTSEPPRRTARGRGNDRLILYMLLTGDNLLSPEKQTEYLAKLAKKYYATPGSVTSAMKTLAEELNQYLLGLNRIEAEKSRQCIGYLCQWVVREEQFYLAVSGPVQAFLVSDQGTQQLSSVDSSSRGLGIVRMAPVSFAHANYSPNNALILVGKSDPAWSPQTWQNLHGQGLEGIRRKLDNQASSDFDIFIGQVRPGKGLISLFQPRSIQTEKSASRSDEAAQKTADTPAVMAVEQPNDGLQAAAIEKPATEGVDAASFDSPPEQTTTSKDSTQVFPPFQKPAITLEGKATDTQPEKKSVAPRQAKRVSDARSGLNSFTATLRRGLQRSFAVIGQILGKMFPEELFQTIPSSVMAALAIIIPLIVVTAASVAYFQLGRSTQYKIYYAQAEQTAVKATTLNDLLDQRVNWIAVLSLLDQAENYQITQQTQTLRYQASYALDNIDLIKRIEYQPAIEAGLPGTVNITKMVISAGDLYMLDSKSGKVYRARPATLGYQIDTSFQCSSTSSGGAGMGAIVDIAAWPTGFQPEASVLGIDLSGNIAFCKPGSPMTVLRLNLPQSAVGSVKTIDISGNELYVISDGSNAVWAFTQKTFDQLPRDYFTNDLERPDQFDTAVSFVVDRDDLYLLHKDGNLTYCSTVDIIGVPIRCADTSFIDMRPGRENSPFTISGPMQQMMLSSPPDPSLFFLEPSDQSIYHFSLRSLVFQRHYKPQKQLSLLPATAFAFFPERRTLFLAIGNEVFYGTIQ